MYILFQNKFDHNQDEVIPEFFGYNANLEELKLATEQIVKNNKELKSKQYLWSSYEIPELKIEKHIYFDKDDVEEYNSYSFKIVKVEELKMENKL